jgi:hypothetical protein
MDQVSRQYTTELIENIDMKGVRRILDVAGAAGRLVIKDMIPETNKPMPQHMAMFSTLMPAISHGGQLHDEVAYTQWCTAAGLEQPERIDCWERSSLLIARKPLWPITDTP